MKQVGLAVRRRRPAPGKTHAPVERQSAAAEAAIQVLAERGAHGLTHRKIDAKLGWPEGSASNYFRRRFDLFAVVAARIMALDLNDLAIVDADLDRPGDVTVDWLVEHMVHLINRSMAPDQRSRSVARAEILFECFRNAELREAVEAEFGFVATLLARVFTQLGSCDPEASARFLSTMMTATFVGLSVAGHPPKPGQVEAMVRNWIAIGLE